MKRKFGFKRIIISAIVISALAIVGMNFIKTSSFYQSTDRAFFSFMSMIRYGIVDHPITTMSNITKDVATSWDLRYENDRLREQLEATSQWESLVLELRDEVNTLKELNELQTLHSEFTLINATVKTRPFESWDKTLTIDIGSADGVSVDDGVMSTKGIIGRVIEVSEHQSVVSLITANQTESQVALRIHVDDTTVVNGILSGFDTTTGLFSVRLLEATSTITAGMKVTTSGLGGVYPSGLLIGNVDSVYNVADGVGVVVNVKSEMNFDDIRYVAVVKKP